MASDLVAKLNVPKNDQAAFNELYQKRLQQGRGKPCMEDMKNWSKVLADKPAEAQVRAFIKDHEKEIAELAKSSGLKREALEQTLVFTGVYGQTSERTPLPFKDALKVVTANIRAAAANPAPKDCCLTLREGTFDKRHLEIRTASFPYKPASATGGGGRTVDCYFTPDRVSEVLVGYIAPGGGYIDDLAVLPAWQGRQIAKGLICKAAEMLSNQGIERIHLHVRAINYPAISLYREGCGFTVSENVFPGWYDWHGGYEMDAKCSDVAARLPERWRLPAGFCTADVASPTAEVTAKPVAKPAAKPAVGPKSGAGVRRGSSPSPPRTASPPAAKAAPPDVTAICVRDGCGKPTWNGHPNEYCGRSCSRAASPPEPKATVGSNGAAAHAAPDEFHTWTNEQARCWAVSQTGASNCGATALLNVLAALEVPVPDVDTAERAVHTNLRKHHVSVSEYLAARSVAGCTGENIVSGCTKVAGDAVESRFFAFYPPREVDLQKWLARWLAKGCSAVATLNTQKMYGADYWHHQMIHGVSKKGVCLTNGIQTLGFDAIRVGLETPSVLQIMKHSALACAPFDADRCDELGPEWAKLQVSEQLQKMKAGFCKEQYVYIPAAYRAGITIFAKRKTVAAQLLRKAPELPEK